MGTLGQVFGTSTRGEAPRLWVRADGAPSEVRLEGSTGFDCGPRTCVGRDGPCGNPVDVFRQCADCMTLSRPACVFEPVCDPCTCIEFQVPHAVYIAWYGILPKVGMTQEGRIGDRLQEQGADAWFTVGTGFTRAEARAREKEISRLWRIPERRVAREKLGQLNRAVPWESLTTRAMRLRKGLEARYTCGELVRMEDHAIAGPLPQRPAIVEAGSHRGTWLGGKGPYAFYRPSPGPFGERIFALNLDDLVGRALTTLPME